MLGKAKNIHQGATEIADSQSNVTKIIQNLGKDFSGKLPTLMTGNILSMKNKYKELNETLDQYGKFLTHAANTYEWNDKETAQWIRNSTQVAVRRNEGLYYTMDGDGSSGSGTQTENFDLAPQDMNSDKYKLPPSALMD